MCIPYVYKNGSIFILKLLNLYHLSMVISRRVVQNWDRPIFEFTATPNTDFRWLQIPPLALLKHESKSQLVTYSSFIHELPDLRNLQKTFKCLGLTSYLVIRFNKTMEPDATYSLKFDQINPDQVKTNLTQPSYIVKSRDTEYTSSQAVLWIQMNYIWIRIQDINPDPDPWL